MSSKKASGKSAKAGKSDSLTKAQLMSEIAQATELSNSNVNSVFDALTQILERELKARRTVALNGLLKIRVNLKKAQGVREMRNPKTGATIKIKAKPAHYVIKVNALSKLKEMAPKN